MKTLLTKLLFFVSVPKAMIRHMLAANKFASTLDFLFLQINLQEKTLLRFKRILFFVLLFTFSTSYTFSQVYVMNGTPITDCSGFFHDSSASGSYGINENFTTTICSNQSSGTHIQLQFSGIDIGTGETFLVYDADTTDPDFLMDDSFLQFPHNPFILQASIINPSGCLTIVFTSDDIDNGNTGWAAAIHCINSCQNIIASLSSSIPEVMPQDTGWIDICPGDEVQFIASGAFPQNLAAYVQSNELCIFEWNFGDGIRTEGIEVSHTFSSSGGYIVQLKITDQMGCENTNFISQRIRVATKPTFIIDDSINDVVCSGDTILITSGVAPSEGLDVIASPRAGAFSNGFCSLDTLLIPDGIGNSYQRSIFLTQFTPDVILTDTNDLESIGISIEHSYVGDLEIELICPNGSSSVILNHNIPFGTTNFGEPVASAPSSTIDDICLGVPYTYYFVNEAENGTLKDLVPTLPVIPQSSIDCGTANNYIYSDRQFPEGEYEPEESFSNLLGCPLNGEWTLRITDNFAQDNGWLTGWCINFAGHLIPYTESFTPNLIEWAWAEHNSIISASSESMLAIPLGPDTIDYSFLVADDFGCIFDTIVQIEVLSPNHPDCMTSNINTLIEVPIHIFPNPVQSILSVEIPNSEFNFSKMEIFNTLGQKVISQVIPTRKMTLDIDLSHLASGAYYILFRGDNAIATIKKIILQQD